MFLVKVSLCQRWCWEFEVEYVLIRLLQPTQGIKVQDKTAVRDEGGGSQPLTSWLSSQPLHDRLHWLPQLEVQDECDGCQKEHDDAKHDDLVLHHASCHSRQHLARLPDVVVRALKRLA